jgi:hypothetical protein
MTTISKKFRVQFAYIHHGTEPSTAVGFGDYVNEDTEVGKQGSRVLAGQLGIPRDVHSLDPWQAP